MKARGFTLIELIVVIVILGILAVTALPKFVNFQAEAKTATLEAVKASMEGAAALVYGKSLVKGNHKEAFSLTNSINIGDGKGLNSDGEFFVNYGYPIASPSEFDRLINLDDNYKKIAVGTDLKSFIVYLAQDNAPSSINDACLVSYTTPNGVGEKPVIKVNPCE